MESMDTKGGKAVVGKPGTGEGNKTAAESRLVVVDLGKKQSGKKIRRLRKGGGPLLNDVKALVAQTKENLELGDNVVPIVVVVRKKRNNRLFW